LITGRKTTLPTCAAPAEPPRHAHPARWAHLCRMGPGGAGHGTAEAAV